MTAWDQLRVLLEDGEVHVFVPPHRDTAEVRALLAELVGHRGTVRVFTVGDRLFLKEEER